MVSVIVVTYNQEHWIRQTLESILSQKTSYPFEVIVGEDMGQDETRRICEEYAQRFDNVRMAPQDHNLGVTANWLNCIAHSSGKYIMNCAGDDYWHNPNKIQLQVDFMESHPDCVLCHTDCDVLCDKTGKIEHNQKNKNGIVPPEGRIQKEVLKGNAFVVAATQCFRHAEFDQFIPKDKYLELGFPCEDWPTQVILAAHGDINYIPISTSTYRIGHLSITNSRDYDKIWNRNIAGKRMTEFLYSMFPEYGQMDETWYDNFVYHSLLVAAYENDDFRSAKRFAANDIYGGRMVKMTKYWLTFKLYRILRLLKDK